MQRSEYQRILMVRTDRLGDVVLTTPAIKALRNAYPNAHLAMMVRPYTELVVKGNPYLDEVIVYDKDKRHRSIFSTIRFIMELRKKKFDLAIIFDPANRAHIITYLANIPRRIGYDEKSPLFLTDRIRNSKHEGIKHEADYALDMLKLLRIECSERQIYVPVPQEASDYIKSLLLKYGINEKDKLVVIHPGASCPSKIWPLERFSKLVDKLIDTYRVKAIVIGGADNRALFCVEAVKKFMLQEAVFLPNKLNVQQLAALFKKASLFVSNDSGPVHIAVAVNTPVVAIFGRNQPGLSPTRWGPLGPRDIALHKNIGCKICLAHNCKRGFECLKAISVEEVFSSIKDMGILD